MGCTHDEALTVEGDSAQRAERTNMRRTNLRAPTTKGGPDAISARYSSLHRQLSKWAPDLRAPIGGLFVAVALLAVGACGGSSSPTSPSPPTLPHGTASDPPDDARVDSRIPRSPDLVSATFEVTASDLRISLRFTPGSFDRNTSVFQFTLDTDENVQTGLPGVNGTGDDASRIGADYVLDSYEGAVLLFRCSTRRVEQCSRAGAPIATDVADGIDLVVSRADLGNDDGKMTFKVTATARIGGIVLEPDVDVMPDIGVPAARVQ